MRFEQKIISETVQNLLEGKDYRTLIINSINVKFFDFTMDFFRAIIEKKLQGEAITSDWYETYFIKNTNLTNSEIATNACLNEKTINNIQGKIKRDKGYSKREIVLDMSINNYQYLKQMVKQLEYDSTNDLNIEIKITKNNVSVELSLSESLIVINALATKKIALRGGAWSSIGKQVEKPLLIELCRRCNLQPNYYNAKHFIKDKSKAVDREVDFILYDNNKTEYRCEVKLMGRGNPESADAVIARDSKVFIADTLSEQNKNQLDQLDVLWVELKNHTEQDIISQFKNILKKLNISTQTS